MMRLAVVCTLVLVPLALAQEPRRDDRDEVARLARRLEQHVRELREEVIHVFRMREEHRGLERHLREVERLSESLHKATERTGEGRSRWAREVLDKIDVEMREIDLRMGELGRVRDIDRKAFDRARDEMADINRILYRIRREIG
jgi:hypothetical protein